MLKIQIQINFWYMERNVKRNIDFYSYCILQKLLSKWDELVLVR